MKKIGIVTESEKNEILFLHERMMGIKELILTLDTFSISKDEKEEFECKIDCEKNNVKRSYDKWWMETALKYNWERKSGCDWTINFLTNEIFLSEI